jgi:hypothetical protein
MDAPAKACNNGRNWVDFWLDKWVELGVLLDG